MKIINLQFFNKKKKGISEIIQGCKRNDEYCQELLFKQYAPKVMAICQRYEHPSFGAKDILQETFIAVFNNISQFNPEKAKIETWIKKIAVNTALKIIRGRKLHLADMELENIELIDESSMPQDVEKVSEEYILKAVQKLPLGYRTVFNMYIIDGFSHQEIAEVLNVSPQTSMSQLSKAKKMLRTKLKLNAPGKKKISMTKSIYHS